MDVNHHVYLLIIQSSVDFGYTKITQHAPHDSVVHLHKEDFCLFVCFLYSLFVSFFLVVAAAAVVVVLVVVLVIKQFKQCTVCSIFFTESKRTNFK